MTDQIAKELDIVALLRDLPGEGLTRGQVGTVVDAEDGNTFILVEFTDGDGRTVAWPHIKREDLLVLKYDKAAAE